MQITSSNYGYIPSRLSAAVTARSMGANTTKTANATDNEAPGGTAERADFTAMTRKELFDWMNSKIKSGEMSLDDSTVFLGMTIHIPAGGGQPDSLDDQEQVNFLELAQNGMTRALQQHDEELRMRLAKALGAMEHYQGQFIRLDAHA